MSAKFGGPAPPGPPQWDAEWVNKMPMKHIVFLFSTNRNRKLKSIQTKTVDLPHQKGDT